MNKTKIKQPEENGLTAIEQNENFLAIAAGAVESLSFAEKIDIKDDVSIERYNSGLATVKDALTRAENTRRSFTDPLNDRVKKINDLFRPFTEKFKQAESLLKGKYLSYHDEQERLATAAKAKIEKDLAANKITLAKAAEKIEKIVEPPKTELSSFSGAKSTIVTRIVVEIENEQLIPRAYLNVDLARVEVSLKKGIKVPGAKLVEKKTVASGRGFAF